MKIVITLLYKTSKYENNIQNRFQYMVQKIIYK